MSKQKKKLSQTIVQSPSRKNDPISFIIVLFLAAIFIYLCFVRTHIQDDAFISFRYVRNFINGNGLVFNPGEYVEGFSSLLWVLILSFTTLLGFEIVSTAQLLGVLCGSLLIILLLPFSKLLFNKLNISKNANPLFHIAASFMLTFNGAFQYWAISGMETTLFVLLMTAAIYFYFYQENYIKFYLSSFLFMLASFTRPEANIVFVIVVFHLLINSFKKKNEGRISGRVFSKMNIIFISIYILPNLFYLIFRIIYYGYPLPNTFYAKTGTSIEYFLTGVDYTIDFMKTYMLWGIIYVAPILLFFKKVEKRNISLLIVLILLYTLYIILVGGDVLPIYRFFIPILPIILILLISTIYIIFNKNGKPILTTYLPVLLIILLTAYNYFIPNDKIETSAYYEDNLVTKMSSSGRWLNDYQKYKNKRIIIAATTIGALSYYSDAVVIDMLGLTDETIAHNPKPINEISQSDAGWKERKYNADYVLSKNPDFIYFSTGIKPSAFAERALFAKEKFLNEYYQFHFEAIHGFTESMYKRKDDPIDVKDYILFSSNPNFNLNYIDLFVQTINFKMTPDKYEQTKILCEEIIKIGPRNFSDPYRILATIYANEKNDSLALLYLQKLLDVNDYDVIGHQAMYRYHFVRNNPIEAQKHFDKIMEYNPEYISTSMYR